MRWTGSAETNKLVPLLPDAKPASTSFLSMEEIKAWKGQDLCAWIHGGSEYLRYTKLINCLFDNHKLSLSDTIVCLFRPREDAFKSWYLVVQLESIKDRRLKCNSMLHKLAGIYLFTTEVAMVLAVTVYSNWKSTWIYTWDVTWGMSAGAKMASDQSGRTQK